MGSFDCTVLFFAIFQKSTVSSINFLLLDSFGLSIILLAPPGNDIPKNGIWLIAFAECGGCVFTTSGGGIKKGVGAVTVTGCLKHVGV